LFWKIVGSVGAYADAIVYLCTLVSAIETNLFFQAFDSEHFAK
jgi:hypothetical protein